MFVVALVFLYQEKSKRVTYPDKQTSINKRKSFPKRVNVMLFVFFLGGGGFK